MVVYSANNDNELKAKMQSSALARFGGLDIRKQKVFAFAGTASDASN